MWMPKTDIVFSYSRMFTETGLLLNLELRGWPTSPWFHLLCLPPVLGLPMHAAATGVLEIPI